MGNLLYLHPTILIFDRSFSTQFLIKSFDILTKSLLTVM